MTYLVEKFLFPKTTIPFLPTALFCFAASVSYVFILLAHNLKVNFVSILAFPFFCAFPIWRFIGEFPANLPSAAWGLLACSIAAYLFKIISVQWSIQQNPLSKKLAIGFFAQAFLVATAVGSYQSYILAFGCFGLGIIIRTIMAHNDTDLKSIVRMLVLLAAASVLGLLIYGAIEFTFLYALDLKISYIQNFYNPDRLAENPLKVIGATLSQAGKLYFGPLLCSEHP